MRRSSPAIDVEKLEEGRGGRLRMPPRTSQPRQYLLILSAVTRNVNQTTKRHRTKIEHDELLIPSEDGERARPHRDLFCNAAKSAYISHIPTLLLAKSIYLFALLASLCDDEISTIYTVISI